MRNNCFDEHENQIRNNSLVPYISDCRANDEHDEMANEIAKDKGTMNAFLYIKPFYF